MSAELEETVNARLAAVEAKDEAFNRYLAQIIKEFWSGHSVTTTVTRVPRKRGWYQVRSDMLNGMPRGYAPRKRRQA